MPSYEHKKLIERISQLDELSEAAAEYAIWIKAYGHLTLLRDNGKEDELIIYASGNYTLIHTVVASEDSLSYLNKDDLLHWSSDPFSSCASYVWGGWRDDVWIERGGCCNWGLGSKTLENERELVFERSFERWKGEGRSYFEILQEYSHLTEIHWRPEERAYCRFDEHGDLDHVVSVTSQEDIGVVSFRWDPLQRYLAASNSVLVRMFDFTLLRRENFTAWPDEPENVINESDVFFYRQKVDPGKAAYTRGVQIIRPSRPKCEIFSSMKERQFGYNEGQYVEFAAYDWRNKRITNISTDPAATTNYFQARDNSLPFELSARSQTQTLSC